jgi:hypothetical protein
MNKEQQELLDYAYNRYRATIIKEFYEDTKELRKWATVEGPGGHTKEEFINKCKTDSEFSEKWGLKIEERELNDDELNIANLFKQTSNKLITITYNDKTIENYE